VQKINVLGFRARAFGISSLASGRGGLRYIAAGSQADAKTGCLPLLVVLDGSTFTTLYSIRYSAILSS
jgi:hypothetical protein